MSGYANSFHPSALAVCNIALRHIGEKGIVALNTESTDNKTQTVSLLYEDARLQVLDDHNWGFARKDAEVESCECDSLGDTMPYSFAYPSNCLRILACYGMSGERVNFAVVEGQTVKCANMVARVRYLEDVKNINLWSPRARRALIHRIAADISKPITGRINERQIQEDAYTKVLEDARLHDSQEGDTTEAYGDNYYAQAMIGNRSSSDARNISGVFDFRR